LPKCTFVEPEIAQGEDHVAFDVGVPVAPMSADALPLRSVPLPPPPPLLTTMTDQRDHDRRRRDPGAQLQGRSLQRASLGRQRDQRHDQGDHAEEDRAPR
jgi:hypothetical protein